MAQEDDLRALGKIMDFMRGISVLFLLINCYWFCYETFHTWGLTLSVLDKILMNFQRTAGLFSSILWTKLFCVLFLALSCLGTRGVKEEKITWAKIWTVLTICAILPQLVATDTSDWSRWCSFALHLHTLCGVYLPAEGWCMDESPAEKQPNGRCIQYGE